MPIGIRNPTCETNSRLLCKSKTTTILGCFQYFSLTFTSHKRSKDKK